MIGHYRVKIRRDFGLEVRPEAEQIDGKVYLFEHGFQFDDDERYPGETAMLPNDMNYPASAPHWIASGDLEPADE